MKTEFVYVIVVSMFVCCLTPLSHADEATADSASKFIKSWAAAYTQNDPVRMMQFYDQSPETEIVISAGVIFQGHEAIKELYDESKREVRFLKSDTKNLRTRLLGNTAVVTFEHVFETEHLSEKSRWRGHVRTSSILHRIEDKWRIVHEHSSPIHGIDRISPVED